LTDTQALRIPMELLPAGAAVESGLPEAWREGIAGANEPARAGEISARGTSVWTSSLLQMLFAGDTL
jgi:hypothetical protein